MPPQAPPRLVSISTGEPLPILPPSVALSESLCDLTEGKPSADCILAAGSVMDLVARHCLGVPVMAFVGMAREGETTAKGGPWRWPEIVRAIISTWPDDGPWNHWRGLVGACVAVYVEHMQAPLWALDPAKVRASEEEDGIQAAAAWLSRVEPPAPAPPVEATPAPAVAPSKDKAASSKLSATKRAMVIATDWAGEGRDLAVANIAREAGCSPSYLHRQKKFMSLLNQLARSGKAPPKGWKSGETGALEAYGDE